MKLSEAIRLGAMMRPQYRGNLYGKRWWQKQVGSCAMGAAIEAAGLAPEPASGRSGGVLLRGSSPATQTYRIPSDWHRLLTTYDHCPVCRQADYRARIVAHLNDTHQYARERIADWIATIEPQEDAHGTDIEATASGLSVPESLER